jgi:hypothetical protein
LGRVRDGSPAALRWGGFGCGQLDRKLLAAQLEDLDRAETALRGGVGRETGGLVNGIEDQRPADAADDHGAAAPRNREAIAGRVNAGLRVFQSA